MKENTTIHFTVIELPVVRKCYTLIELLVTLSIIGILMSLLLTVLEKSKEELKKVACADNVEQLISGMIQYTYDNGGRYPSGAPAGDNRSWDCVIRRYNYPGYASQRIV